MSAHKGRLTVTVDHSLLRAGREAVSAGRADSISSWVNLALTERVAKERRLGAMGEAIAQYEARFGVISDRELTEQIRADRQSAVVVRGSRKPSRRTRGAAG